MRHERYEISSVLAICSLLAFLCVDGSAAGENVRKKTSHQPATASSMSFSGSKNGPIRVVTRGNLEEFYPLDSLPPINVVKLIPKQGGLTSDQNDRRASENSSEQGQEAAPKKDGAGDPTGQTAGRTEVAGVEGRLRKEIRQVKSELREMVVPELPTSIRDRTSRPQWRVREWPRPQWKAGKVVQHTSQGMRSGWFDIDN